MAARTAYRDLKTSAAKSLGNHRVGACSVQDQRGTYLVFPLGFFKQITDTTQISFAFLANIAHEKNSGTCFDGRFLKGLQYGDQRGNTGAIVTDSRGKYFAAFGMNINLRLRRKNGIDVRSECD